MVPASLGCGSLVLAAIAMLAPSRAARSAIASPIPRDAPVMSSVRPFRDMGDPCAGLPPWALSEVKLLGALVMRGNAVKLAQTAYTCLRHPRIHLLRKKVLTRIDGLPGHARQ